MKPRRPYVAIVGFTPHRSQAPFENPDWEIWGLNDLYIDLPVVPNDRLGWFQLHPWRDGRPVDSAVDLTAGPYHPRDPNHVAWLATMSSRIPIWIREKRDEVPDGIAFGYDDLYRYFGRRYFTNSISYMIGLAIQMGYEKIGVYGVDMMTAGGNGSEYGYQRPSCEWLLGWAMCKLGPENVVIPAESDLLASAYTYADEDGNRFRSKLEWERQEMNNRLAGIRNQKRAAELGEAELVGAVNTYEGILRRWMPGDGDHNLGTAPDANAHKIPVDELQRWDDAA